MVDLYAKFKCYKCDETYLGRDIIKGSSIGSGFFTEYMCEDCTKENYIWATGDDLVTEHHKANIREMNKIINTFILTPGTTLDCSVFLFFIFMLRISINAVFFVKSNMLRYFYIWLFVLISCKYCLKKKGRIYIRPCDFAV